MRSLTSILPTRYGIVTMSGISARNWYRRELSRLHIQVRMASHGLQCSMLRYTFGRVNIYSKSFAFAFWIAQHLLKLFHGANCDQRTSSMIHLSSKDSPSMVKITTCKVLFTNGENKENHSIPSNIPCVKVGTIWKAMLQIWYSVNLIGKVIEWSNVITDWIASRTGIGATFTGVTVPI